MASTIPRSRLLELAKVTTHLPAHHNNTHPMGTRILTKPPQLQSTLFSTTFNPQQRRLGNKVLRQRLRGPAVASYYPRRSTTIEDMLDVFGKRFGLEGWNDLEIDREENVQLARMRGKGAPAKKKTKDESGKKKKR